MNYLYILFDLDGTLTDPQVGITKSVQYALRHFGIDEPDLLKLNTFIGPPLTDSFMKFYGFDEAQATQAINFFREYFSKQGILENVLYEEVAELLAELHQAGYQLAVATSKPTVFAKQILDHYQIAHYFKAIVGSNLDNSRTDKAEIIAFACNELGITDLSNVLMIGDRKYDIAGAQAHGITSIGVTYGYGSKQELEKQGPNYLIDTVIELRELLKRLN